MSRYFTEFPIVTYDSVRARDITRRTNFITDNLSNPFVFLPYTVKENEKPEDVAFLYYGSVDFTWIVLMANEIKDPYSEWYMNENQLHGLLMKKYAELSGETGYGILNWLQNTTSLYNVLYYEKDGIAKSPESFDTEYERDEETGEIVILPNGQKSVLSRAVPGDWIPVRIYDYELQLNENRREIVLVDKSFVNQIEKEFRKKIKT